MSSEELTLLDLLDRLLSTPGGRRLIIVLCIIGLLALGVFELSQLHRGNPTVTTAGGPTVRIATWNLHVFAPRSSIDLRRIAQIITDSRFDVVALQEIRDNGVEVDRLLNTLGPPWRGTRVSEETGNHEYFEFIYDGSHVAETGSAHTVSWPNLAVFNRRPYEASFAAGQLRFTLMTAHLYYGKSEGRRIASSELSKRQAEAEELARMAASAESSQNDHVIVLGDFNEQHAHGFLHCFEEEGWQRLITDGTNLSGSETFDNILIDPSRTNEWTGHCGAVHFDEEFYPGDRHEAVEAVSDHRPAWADFATGY